MTVAIKPVLMLLLLPQPTPKASIGQKSECICVAQENMFKGACETSFKNANEYN